MGLLSDLWSAIVGFAKRIWNSIKKIYRAVIRLMQEVIEYFKGLHLDQNKHKPFIGDFAKLKQAINNAPVRNVGVFPEVNNQQTGIFRGVYNMQTDDIEVLEAVEANSLDNQTKGILRDDALVVLS